MPATRSATSRASVVNPPNASTRLRCASASPSVWCACWPWIATSRAPSSASCASVAGRPLIHARLLPCASSTRRSRSSSPSLPSSCSASHARTAGRVRDVELRGELRAFGARAQLAQLEAVAQQQAERVEQDRLAGAGLAGEHGEARRRTRRRAPRRRRSCGSRASAAWDERTVAGAEAVEGAATKRRAAAGPLSRRAAANCARARRSSAASRAASRSSRGPPDAGTGRGMRRAPQRDAVPFGEREVRLAVAVHGGVAAAHQVIVMTASSEMAIGRCVSACGATGTSRNDGSAA